jgi:hypothetical protein
VERVCGGWWRVWLGGEDERVEVWRVWVVESCLQGFLLQYLHVGGGVV